MDKVRDNIKRKNNKEKILIMKFYPGIQVYQPNEKGYIDTHS